MSSSLPHEIRLLQPFPKITNLKPDVNFVNFIIEDIVENPIILIYLQENLNIQFKF